MFLKQKNVVFSTRQWKMLNSLGVAHTPHPPPPILGQTIDSHDRCIISTPPTCKPFSGSFFQSILPTPPRSVESTASREKHRRETKLYLDPPHKAELVARPF